MARTISAEMKRFEAMLSDMAEGVRGHYRIVRRGDSIDAEIVISPGRGDRRERLLAISEAAESAGIDSAGGRWFVGGALRASQSDLDSMGFSNSGNSSQIELGRRAGKKSRDLTTHYRQVDSISLVLSTMARIEDVSEIRPSEYVLRFHYGARPVRDE